ncbi:MAG: hypothetical protein KDB84_03760 [Flavobacteriales bacterium]|nr:hypothetical protein [Flavobacteriales bacterium]
MRSLILLSLLAFVTACSSTRKQLESAGTYEREGMWREAFEGYKDLYLRRPSTVEAHVGMKRTAQARMDRMQQDAMAGYLASDLERAEAERTEAERFRMEMERYRLDLQWDPLLEEHRNSARAREAERLYTQAETAFRAERFAECEALLDASLRLAPDRKDTEYLRTLAQLEPLYRQGQRAVELGLWRDGYRLFKRITDRDATYKDAWDLRTACAEKATYTLAYVPLFNDQLYTAQLGSGPGVVETQLAAMVKQAVLDLNDALILLVDRDNTNELLAEQQRQMSGTFDDRHVAEAGRLLGARFVLTGKVLRFDDIIRKEIDVEMQLIDAATGRIHLSEVIRVNKQEIARGAPRAQLLERSAKRMALRLTDFDPTE